MIRERHIIAVLLCAVLFVSCNSTGCVDNQSALPLAGFYDYATLRQKTISKVEIGAVGAPNDSLLVDGEGVSQSYMPFNIDAGETVFFVRYKAYGLDDPAMFDTLRFTYDRVPYFASEDCGVMYKYVVTDLWHTSHRIDSVAMPYTTITQLDVVSIEIYFGDLTPLPRPQEENAPRR